MKLKLIKAMLGIIDWISDDIGKEVDKEDFINKIKVDLMAVDEEIQEDDIIIKNQNYVFWIEISTIFYDKLELHVHYSDLDEEGFKI